MHYRDLIDVPQIPWTPIEERATGHGPVRHVPIEEASAAPEPYAATVPMFLPVRLPGNRKPKPFPACAHADGHRMVSNGAPDGTYRMKCSRCHRSRKATAEEAVALLANGGHKGRRKADG